MLERFAFNLLLPLVLVFNHSAGFEIDTSISDALGVQGSASSSSFLSGGSATDFQRVPPGQSKSSRTFSAKNYSRSVAVMSAQFQVIFLSCHFYTRAHAVCNILIFLIMSKRKRTVHA